MTTSSQASIAANAATKTSRRRQHREPYTVEQTLAILREDNPKASAAELRLIAHQWILDRVVFEDEDTRVFVMGLVDGDLHRRIKDPSPTPAQREISRVERTTLRQKTVETLKQKDEQRIEAKVEAEITIRMLDYQTTYGKALGDCTGAECDRLSRRYGDFFFELAKRITRSETVRAHLTEEELRAIAKTHRLIGEKATR